MTDALAIPTNPCRTPNSNRDRRSGAVDPFRHWIKARSPDLVILDWHGLGQRINALLDLLGLLQSPPVIIRLSVRAENRQAAVDGGVSGAAVGCDSRGLILSP